MQVNEELYEPFMGKNYKYYKNIIEKDNIKKFNYAAFFLTIYWLAYRKLYRYFFIYLIIFTFIEILSWILKVTNIIGITGNLINLFLLLSFSLYLGYNGNKLYINEFLKYEKNDKKQTKYNNLKKWIIFILLFILTCSSSIFITSFIEKVHKSYITYICRNYSFNKKIIVRSDNDYIILNDHYTDETNKGEIIKIDSKRKVVWKKVLTDYRLTDFPNCSLMFTDNKGDLYLFHQIDENKNQKALYIFIVNKNGNLIKAENIFNNDIVDIKKLDNGMILIIPAKDNNKIFYYNINDNKLIERDSFENNFLKYDDYISTDNYIVYLYNKENKAKNLKIIDLNTNKMVNDFTIENFPEKDFNLKILNEDFYLLYDNIADNSYLKAYDKNGKLIYSENYNKFQITDIQYKNNKLYVLGIENNVNIKLIGYNEIYKKVIDKEYLGLNIKYILYKMQLLLNSDSIIILGSDMGKQFMIKVDYKGNIIPAPLF